MATSTTIPSSFITSIIPKTSTATSTPTQIATSAPQAPPTGYVGAPGVNDGWSPAAIIGIVATIVIVLLFIPLIAVSMRRYERKRPHETVKNSSSSDLGSTKSSVKNDSSLRSIMVTRELQRTSTKLPEGVVAKPEQVYVHDRAWSRTEVKGGGMK